MSDALTPASPESPAGTPSVEDTVPAVVEEVVVGSAGEAATQTVDAERFNGLMSSHQKALADLRAMQAEKAALEARLVQQETPVVTEANEEVQMLREELKQSRLDQAKADALRDFPGAKPLADMIVGSTAAEIRDVAAAIEKRLADLIPTPVVEADPTVVVEAPPAVETTPVVEAPVVAGGATPPSGEVADTALRSEALAEGSWDKFWQSASSPSAALS